MRGRRRLLTTLGAVLLALVLAACGGGDGTSTAGSTGTTSTADGGSGGSGGRDVPEGPAKLPDGWKRVVNDEAGFSFGIPPGWSARMTPGGQGSIVTSPDELVTLTITADRTRGALALPLDEFATRTAEALGSDVVGRDRFKNLFVTRPAPFKDPYEASAVRASGKSARTGIEELIFVVVLRDPGEASYVVVSRENADEPSETASRDDVKQIIRTIRTAPAA